VFVKFGSNIDCGSLDGLEKHFYRVGVRIQRERERMKMGIYLLLLVVLHLQDGVGTGIQELRIVRNRL
jgi:hypothetical protein